MDNEFPTYILSETNNSGWTAELTDGDDEQYYDTIFIDYDKLPKDAQQLDLVSPLTLPINKETHFQIVKKFKNE